MKTVLFLAIAVMLSACGTNEFKTETALLSKQFVELTEKSDLESIRDHFLPDDESSDNIFIDEYDKLSYTIETHGGLKSIGFLSERSEDSDYTEVTLQLIFNDDMAKQFIIFLEKSDDKWIFDDSYIEF